MVRKAGIPLRSQHKGQSGKRRRVRPHGCAAGRVLVGQHEQESVDGVLDDQRDLITDSWQRRGERDERHVPVLTHPRKVLSAAVRGGHPSDTRLDPDCGVHFCVELAIREARRRRHALTGSDALLQRRGVLFEALADRVEFRRVERFRDFGVCGFRFFPRRGVVGVIEEVRPARAGVLLLEVQRE